VNYNYRKKPVVVEAFKLGEHDIPYWFMKIPELIMKRLESGSIAFVIPTLEGNMEANLGDYIIKGVKGEIYPCKSDIFEITYEKLEKN